MSNLQKAIGKVLAARTMDEIRTAAARYSMIVAGRIDVRGRRCRFNHSELDFREFLVEGCDLSGSVLTNCVGEGVSFDRCKLRRVRITAENGRKVSFRGASFNGSLLEDVTIGPRTLDLSETTYRDAKLRNVTFSMGRLDRADFRRAELADVFFRSAELTGASFNESTLRRVSFEKAILEGADFEGAEFHQIEQWGEPNFHGAKVSDDQKYRFGIVRQPLARIRALISDGTFTPGETEGVRVFLEQNRDFLSNPEVMLIASEYKDMDSRLFIKMMKALKKDTVQRGV